MEPVNRSLDVAMKRLVAKIADLIELGGPYAADDTAAHTLSRLRAASTTASFPVDWPCLLRAMQRSLYDTAFSRYHNWWCSNNEHRRLDLLPQAPVDDPPANNVLPTSVPSDSTLLTPTVSSKKRRGRKYRGGRK